ncbi:MAG: CPBP family glutamic-type intramembrane protease [Acidobacteriaceae bacterium]
MNRSHRFRALLWFVVAAIYYFVARDIASIAANGLSSGIWFDLVDRAILLFLLIIGFAAMGYVGQRQQHPVAAMGLDRRTGARREFALGAAIGWAGMTVCALIIALFGGMVIFFYTNWRQFALIPLVLAILLVASLAEEVAFRGYPFHRLIEATGPLFATLFLSLLYALLHINNPGASPASFLVTMFAGWLLCIAYLRTRALWVGWGIHFAWNASMAVLFGLPLSGLTRFSPVVSSTSLGPTWLTGIDYGPEGSAIGLAVILGLIILTLYATRGLNWQYARPVIVSGAVPVDVDAVVGQQREPIIVPPSASSQPPESAPPDLSPLEPSQPAQVEGVPARDEPPQVSEPENAPENQSENKPEDKPE